MLFPIPIIWIWMLLFDEWRWVATFDWAAVLSNPQFQTQPVHDSMGQNEDHPNPL